MGNFLAISKSFTPISSFAGGIVLGIASSLNLLATGRITGSSGIINGFIFRASDWKFRGAFLTSLIAVGSFVAHFKPETFGIISNDKIDALLPVVSGLLVGFGTQLGSGCTSGHGVCGLPRFSLRSLFAVLCFMSTGILTSSLKGYIAKGLPPLIPLHSRSFPSDTAKIIFLVSTSFNVILTFSLLNNKKIGTGQPEVKSQKTDEIQQNEDTWQHMVVASACGGLFAIGLALSGMCNPEKVTEFLNIFGKEWDPSLAFVMGGAVFFNLLSFPKILKRKSPLLKPSFNLPTKKEINYDLIAGSSIFGIGWGLCGFCPGPAFMSIPSGNTSLLMWFGAMGAGMYMYKVFSTWRLRK